jgi:ABC-type amino acid transport substrate-binding protein
LFLCSSKTNEIAEIAVVLGFVLAVVLDFDYNFEWYGKKVDTVEYKDNDALLQMLKNVFDMQSKLHRHFSERL